MRLVYNPGINAVVYGADGLMVAPGEWAYVEVDAVIADSLDDGRLVELNVPDEMPESVAPKAYKALKAAVDDAKAQREAAQAEADAAAKKAAEDQKNEQVRNTGRSTRNKTNKEA